MISFGILNMSELSEDIDPHYGSAVMYSLCMNSHGEQPLT